MKLKFYNGNYFYPSSNTFLEMLLKNVDNLKSFTLNITFVIEVT